MSYRLSKAARNTLLSHSESVTYAGGMPDAVVAEAASAFPEIHGLVPGMSLEKFDEVMTQSAAEDYKAFVSLHGDAFGGVPAVKVKDREPLMFGSNTLIQYPIG